MEHVSFGQIGQIITGCYERFISYKALFVSLFSFSWNCNFVSFATEALSELMLMLMSRSNSGKVCIFIQHDAVK